MDKGMRRISNTPEQGGAMRAFFSRMDVFWGLTLGFQCGTTCSSILEKSYPQISTAAIAATLLSLPLRQQLQQQKSKGKTF